MERCEIVSPDFFNVSTGLGQKEVGNKLLCTLPIHKKSALEQTDKPDSYEKSVFISSMEIVPAPFICLAGDEIWAVTYLFLTRPTSFIT